MILRALQPRKSLNKAFLKVKPNRTDIEVFKANLITLLDRTNDTESEEFHKNLVSDFLKKTYYEPNHFINTKGRNDLVIHNGNKASSTVRVILEAKKPTNKGEMIAAGNINKKAFQELLLYYLRERITHKNLEVKYLIITNINEWFIFDATTFDRLFAQNKALVGQFTDFEEGRLSETKTDFFYKQIAEPFIANIVAEIEFTYFNLQDYQKPLRNDDPSDDHKLIALFKLLSPEHLLKKPFANDSNSLDKRFYSELLHIIGLTETKEGGKKLIQRNKENDRNTGSILEDAIIQLYSLDKLSRLSNLNQFGSTTQDRLFNVALELSITWVNRILFLKLLEAQLLSYNRIDKLTASNGDASYAFLNFERIKSYDDLNSLFFQVLARKHEDRNADVKNTFAQVPYLNSSLFEPTEIEQDTLFISNLRDDKQLPIMSNTVLKDQNGKKRSGKLGTLEYLFEFLNAYDFGAEGSEEIQEDNKTLINASVLGLIFEKINGYKDGSFFTPGFITMYMCRETIRKAVVQKFNGAFSEKNKVEEQNKYESFKDVYNAIGSRRDFDHQEAAALVNSIKICDPAVGSGHFLVSALNEMIAVKHELGILADREGKFIRDYDIAVENDELVITDVNGALFEYKPNNKESQRIQETLFHEKQSIIENCLFGVDINPNSVKICRLRLWIELLKNAYYTAESNYSQLETLPNIDINIKCGNSLVSRFAIDADLKSALKKSSWTIDSYRNAVSSYRNAKNKEQKREMEQLILKIKQSFSTEIRLNDPLKKRLDKLASELYHRFTGSFLFEPEAPYGQSEKALAKKRKQEQEKLETEINQLEKKIDEIKSNEIFQNAFEWRFEFPEVLNDEGDFIGFDVVIGNPPYIDAKKLADISQYLKQNYSVYYSSSDLSSYFYELGFNVLKQNGFFSFISTNKFFRTEYGKTLREYLSKVKTHAIINFEQVPIFDEALVSSLIVFLEKKIPEKDFLFVEFIKEKSPESGFESLVFNRHKMLPHTLISSESWDFSNQNESLVVNKVYTNSQRIKEIVSIDIKRGVTTGYDPAFIIDNQTKNNLNDSELIKPLLKGAHIKKFNIIQSDVFLIFTKRGCDIENHQSIKNHLLGFYKDLKPKTEKDSRGRKPGSYNWFEIQDNIAYYLNFDEPKIIWPLTAASWGFALDEEKHYLSSGGFMLISEKLSLQYILAILNSNLMKFVFSKIGVMTAGGAYTLKKATIDELPLKLIDNDKQKPFIDLVDQILTAKKQSPTADTTALESEIDRLVYELYGLTEEEIEIIENSTKA